MVSAATKPAVKICGLTRHVDARAAADAGAAYLGVVLVPDSPRGVAESRVAGIRGDIEVPLALVTADVPPTELAGVADRVEADVLQLHGTETPADVRALRDEGRWAIWKSVAVRDASDLEEALNRFAGLVDGIHLDAWHPRRLGGTGARFPWSEVADLVDDLSPDTTFVAAGGLTADNVGEAVELLRPDVVDVSSGVETSPGVKDSGKIRAFIRSAAPKTTKGRPTS